MLAARWGHRRSTDIAILLPERTGLNDAAPGGSVDLAAATGGRLAETLRRQIRVDVTGGRIDVAAITPELQGLERSEEIDGEAAIVLASEQILRGKLKRSDEFLTRDAFDIAVAAKAERRALEIAVNSMSEQESRIAQYNLQVANDDMAREAPNALESVARIYQDLASAAARGSSGRRDAGVPVHGSGCAVTQGQHRDRHTNRRWASTNRDVRRRRSLGRPAQERHPGVPGRELQNPAGDSRAEVGKTAPRRAGRNRVRGFAACPGSEDVRQVAYPSTRVARTGAGPTRHCSATRVTSWRTCSTNSRSASGRRRSVRCTA